MSFVEKNPEIIRLVIKTFEKNLRPRPWSPGLENKTLATVHQSFLSLSLI